MDIFLLSGAFTITQTSISPSPPQVGNSVTLTCQSNSRYEYCDWWLGEWERDKVCKFEWKSRTNSVQRQTCPTLYTRMRFVGENGEYKNNECKVKLSNVQLSDAGNWTCKMESYAKLTRGSTVQKELNLEIGTSVLRNPVSIGEYSGINIWMGLYTDEGVFLIILDENKILF